MLSGKDIRDFREMRGLSLREVAECCELSAQLIGQVETGVKNVTAENHKEIVKGINVATVKKAEKAIAKEEKIVLQLENNKSEE